MLRTTALHMLSTRWRSASKATECELKGLERRLIGRNRSFSYRLVTFLLVSPLSVEWMVKCIPWMLRNYTCPFFVFERSFQIRIRICYFYLPSIYLSIVCFLCIFLCVLLSLSLCRYICLCVSNTYTISKNIYNFPKVTNVMNQITYLRKSTNEVSINEG